MTIHSTDPRDPKRDILRKKEVGMSNVTMIGIAAALVIGLGIVWYAMADHRRNTTSTNPPTIDRSAPPVTTGSGSNVNPGPAQNVPNPATPVAPTSPADR